MKRKALIVLLSCLLIVTLLLCIGCNSTTSKKDGETEITMEEMIDAMIEADPELEEYLTSRKSRDFDGAKAYRVVSGGEVTYRLTEKGEVKECTIEEWCDLIKQGTFVAARTPLQELANYYDGFLVEGCTYYQFIADLFPSSVDAFGISDFRVLGTKVGKGGDFRIYFHNDSCWKYYGVLEFKNGKPQSTVTAVETKPADWCSVANYAR